MHKFLELHCRTAIHCSIALLHHCKHCLRYIRHLQATTQFSTIQKLIFPFPFFPPGTHLISRFKVDDGFLIRCPRTVSERRHLGRIITLPHLDIVVLQNVRKSDLDSASSEKPPRISLRPVAPSRRVGSRGQEVVSVLVPGALAQVVESVHVELVRLAPEIRGAIDCGCVDRYGGAGRDGGTGT